MKRTAWYIHDGKQHHRVSVEAEAFIRKDEREKIAAFIDTGGALWGRSDLEYSDEDILNNLPARIRNGEHDTGLPVK